MASSSANALPAQTKLHTKGKKELENYLSHQMLFAPIWKYVLNVAEVGTKGTCDA